MTYREKFEMEYPDRDIDNYCPSEFTWGIDCDYPGCGYDETCRRCWNREMSSLKSMEIESNIHEEKEISYDEPAPEKTVEIDFLKAGAGIAFGKIKDSGDRTEFSSGAVRDMHEGKGRCDLTPINVMGRYAYYIEDDEDAANILNAIEAFQRTRDTDHLYNALGTFSKNFTNWPTMFLEVAKHFEDGAKKYGESNWQKGIPPKCYIDSAVRHYLKWRRGDNDENHNLAFCWNLMCCIWEVDYGEDWRKDKETT